jgi:hypothetical protein
MQTLPALESSVPTAQRLSRHAPMVCEVATFLHNLCGAARPRQLAMAASAIAHFPSRFTSGRSYAAYIEAPALSSNHYTLAHVTGASYIALTPSFCTSSVIS